MPWDDKQNPWGSGNPGKKKPASDQKKAGGQQPQPDLDAMLRKSREKLNGMFGGGAGGGDNGNDGLSGRAIAGLVFLVLILWLSTGIFVIDEREQGVVMRFGEFHRTTGAGIHYRLPSPIESLAKVPVTVVNRIEIGQRTQTGRGGTVVREVPEESQMLTGDENIVDVPFEVQWVIRDARAFLFNVRNPEETVKSVAESAMREVIGRTPITRAIADGKFQIQQEARELLQTTLDGYGTGVQIEALELGKIKYPSPVRPAFTDVQNAKTEAESAVNKAQAYRNDILPRARGNASQMLQDAEAYAQQVTAKAKGEADRFISVYDEYRQAKDVTRQRIYLETMEEILQGMDKILIDQERGTGSGVVPYLPLNELNKRADSGQ